MATARMHGVCQRREIADLAVATGVLQQHGECPRLRGLRNRPYDRIKDKGVKQAPFYVLLGARMPAILVESAFISNREECRLLTTASYQDHLAESIVQGIRSYIREINPTAFDSPKPGSPG